MAGGPRLALPPSLAFLPSPSSAECLRHRNPSRCSRAKLESLLVATVFIFLVVIDSIKLTSSGLTERGSRTGKFNSGNSYHK
ncbi:hypothetical protein [Adhaeribacter radiodurans]|uniref:Uncharacterized protein n=1 Tax=Adhaeribacter radiodurans TaxID=2745197 RepID=A0A7L7L7X6_9BACT|nr:hypothetical protein [Adhaeribacter radiodurans]QMU28932.1 hypothetical protein HUW48_13175 [Adhaeribacter radiodurans]